MQPFRTWLEHGPDDASAAMNLATLIGRSSTGISRDDLARAVRRPAEALEPLLKALMASGQIVALKVNGQLLYRATG